MKTIQKEFKVFSFEELKPEIKDKVLEKFREQQNEIFWEFEFGYMLENFAEEVKEKLNLDVDIKELQFDFGRGGNFSMSGEDVMGMLKKKYNNLSDLDLPKNFGVYMNYLGGGMNSGLNKSEIGEDIIVLYDEDYYEEHPELEAEKMKRNLTKIKIIEDLEELQGLMENFVKNVFEVESDYYKDENVKDFIEANEYEFLENGEVF